jgi:5'-nucleotidase
MPIILLTNDDGIHSEGLKVLEEQLSALGDLWVIAPSVVKSGCGRSVTLHAPLRAHEIGKQRLVVDGTPVDCVLLGFRKFLPSKPDLVVSGINRGINVAEDLDYSGTVGGAAEGALQGAGSSIAISIFDHASEDLLRWAAMAGRSFSEWFLRHPLPQNTYLNVNLPQEKTNRIRWTKQGRFLGTGGIETRSDPRGQPYYWIGHRPEEDHPSPGTDRGALEEGVISASLLTLDRTYLGPWTPPSLRGVGFEES